MTAGTLRQLFGACDSPTSDHDLNEGAAALRAPQNLKPASVLILLCDTPNGLQVLLTKRTGTLRHHPGQIAFPGGKIDQADITAEAAALREAHEEIGLEANGAIICGRLGPHETVTGYQVIPIVAYMPSVPPLHLGPDEVAEAFFVPLVHFTALHNFRVERRHRQGMWRYYDAVPYGPYYIWGATARMLRMLAQKMVSCI